MSKSNSNVGSPRPLNWKTPEFADPIVRKSTWSERIEQHNRFGTPPTKRGGYNGQASGLQPAPPSEMNPPLTINKALLAPPDQSKPGEAKPQKPRKRDPNGKFATNQSAGKQSAAQEDSVDRQRQAKLNAAKQKMALNPEWGGKTRMGMTNKPITRKGISADESLPPQDPAKPGGDPMANEQSMAPEKQPMMRSPSGMSVFDDPYHPEHESLTPEDHNAAAEFYDRQAMEAEQSGNHVEAVMCQQKAGIHRNMAAESQLPMERAVQNFVGQQDAPPQSQQQQFGKALPGSTDNMNPMNQFLATQGQDQGKPNFGGPSMGPQPGKFDTRTQAPVGPQTLQPGHAGTIGVPQMMPPPPAAPNGSMPELGGNQGTVVGMPPQPQINPQMGMNPMAQPPMFNTSLLDQLLQKPAPPQTMAQPQMQAQPGSAPPPQFAEPQMNESGEEPQEEDEPASTAPFGGDEKEEKSNEETQSNATKSLQAWLRKQR